MKNNVKIMGSGEIVDYEYSQILVHGNLKVKSNIIFDQLYVFGFLNSNSILEGHDVKITGSIKGNSVLQSTNFKCEFSSNSSCKSIVSNDISIFPQKSIFKKNIFFKCDSIIGKNISLSNIISKTISGENVYIKGKSHIQELKYSKTYKISDSCLVDKIEKI